MQPNYLWIIVLTVMFVVPTVMLADCAERREHFGVRSFVCIVALLVLFGVIDTINSTLPRAVSSDLMTYLPSVVTFALGVGALIAATYVCFDVSIWVAAFCGTAGYICQNTGIVLGNILGLAFPVQLPPVLMVHNMAYATLGSIITYIAVYLLMVRRVRAYGLTGIDNRRILLLVVAVIFVNIVSSLTLGELGGLGMSRAGIIILSALHLTTCALMLYLEYEMLYHRRMLREIETTQRVLEERSRQYELSRGNIDAINMKCHDIRHQIRHLSDGGAAVDGEFLADIAREVRVYDSMVKTGNDALDTILTEKSLVCERESISLSCIADGEALSFMAPTDIYALFGNALDNAIEAECQVENHNDRSISLVVRRNGAMTSVHVENYFLGGAEFVDGLPRTTKGDEANHGFGSRSMRMIVERYGGTLAMGTEGSTFYVNALFPRGLPLEKVPPQKGVPLLRGRPIQRGLYRSRLV